MLLSLEYLILVQQQYKLFYMQLQHIPDKVKRRLAAGAKVVDMEASAIMAWSQFRKSKVYQFFYKADYVDHHNRTWDARHEERTTDAMTFFTIALTIAKELER